MFRTLLSSKVSHMSNLCGLNSWTTLGFLIAIAGNSKIMSKYLTDPVWLNLYISLLEQPTVTEADVFKKNRCLRLLETILINWTDQDSSRCMELIKQFFVILGKICMYCFIDYSLIPNPADIKSRVLLTASHSSTVAEEIITLIRRLHTLPL